MSNIETQLGFLREVLAEDKRAVGVLLGAGCPAALETESGAPLIPPITGLTAQTFENLQANEEVREGFGQVKNAATTNLGSDPDIEDFLSFLRTLTDAAGEGSIMGLNAATLRKLDDQACRIIGEIVSQPLPKEPNPYINLARWVGSTDREEPIRLFTTNYDLLLEEALERQRVPYFDGFVGSRNPFFDPHAMEEDAIPARWARLWKLHGSVNWVADDTSGVVRAHGLDGRACIIHPSHLKYDQSRRMPYLAMIDRLRAFLKAPHAVLVTIGFSFRDEHLNEVIRQGLAGNPSALCFGLLRSGLEKYNLARGLTSDVTNLTILCNNSGQVGSKTVEWVGPESGAIGVAAGVEVEPGEEDERVRCTIGDFAEFGRFLSELSIERSGNRVERTNE